MRLTQHSGRGTKLGPYNVKHNDRQFDLEQAPNVDPARVMQNVYYGRDRAGKLKRYQAKDIGKNGIQTFEEQEQAIYAALFMGQYTRQMEAYRKKGNYGRIVDFDDWRASKRYCPEEVVYQLGKVGDAPADPAAAKRCYHDIVRYLTGLGPKAGYTFLDAAIHSDEKGVPHLQLRRVWHYTDSDGVTCIGQEKALEQAGIRLPDPKAKPGRYNNRKKTFDAIVRRKVIEIAEKIRI